MFAAANQSGSSQTSTPTSSDGATDQTGLTSTTTRTIIIQAANANQPSTTAANDNTPSVAATTCRNQAPIHRLTPRPARLSAVEIRDARRIQSAYPALPIPALSFSDLREL
jgi:hypothetical protein